MTRATLLLVGLAACDLGIGSDPNPEMLVCAPGHARETASGPCVVKLVDVTIDGDASEWTNVPDIAISGGQLAIAGNIDENSDLELHVKFAGGPLDSFVLELNSSPIRPASGGTDRITFDASGVRYEKNGLVLVPSDTEARLAQTPDGVEVVVRFSWLPYQGATVLALVGTRGSDVVRAENVPACYGYRSGTDALPSNACEVAAP